MACTIVNCWDLYERPTCGIKYNCPGCVVRREDCPEWQEREKAITDRFCRDCSIGHCRFTYDRRQCPTVHYGITRDQSPTEA